MDRIFIEAHNEQEYQVHNLPRNEGVWVQIENFDVYLRRTDDGLVVDVFDFDDDVREDTIATTYAFDCETQSFREDE